MGCTCSKRADTNVNVAAAPAADAAAAEPLLAAAAAVDVPDVAAVYQPADAAAAAVVVVRVARDVIWHRLLFALRRRPLRARCFYILGRHLYDIKHEEHSFTDAHVKALKKRWAALGRSLRRVR